MKLVICSLAGSVGKTTVTTHLLHPRMPDAKFFAVDTTNQTSQHYGIDVTVYEGQEFSSLYKEIVRNDDLVIDVAGSKEGAEFLSGMDWMGGEDEIDAFIIPSMPDDKDQKAAFKTIELLLAQNVDPSKIKVIFNAVRKSTVAEFDYLLGALTYNKIPYTLDATIMYNNNFNVLSTFGRTLQSIIDDKIDYKKVFASSEKDSEEEHRAGELMVVQKHAPRIKENLDTVFKALFPTA